MDFLHRTWAEIDLDALAHNFEIIKKKAKGAKIYSVVKADGYGHGLEDVVKTLLSCGTDAFAVSNIEEALEVRNAHKNIPILILGYTPHSFAKVLAENDITQAIYSLPLAEKLSESAKSSGVKVKFHLKLDTGMGRIGFDCRSDDINAKQEILSVLKLDNLVFDGIFTHFASSDKDGDEDFHFTKSQITRFNKTVNIVKNAGFSPRVCHCHNSAALFSEESRFDACRPGIILYGLSPMENDDTPFVPVMTLKSVVSFVKTVKKGETISYGRTFTAKSDMKIATVTAGYGDGYPRSLSNKGYVLVNGQKAFIVGRVCMDQFCIDVTHIESITEGDEVILFGKELPVSDVAKIANTIHYEIVCGISKRVPRIVLKKDN